MKKLKVELNILIPKCFTQSPKLLKQTKKNIKQALEELVISDPEMPDYGYLMSTYNIKIKNVKKRKYHV